MADNPYAARPEGSNVGTKPQCPPDMPRGDSPEDKAARQRFWIERGNAQLIEMGKSHLHWRAKDGHYWIEEKEETYRSIEFEQQKRIAAQ